MSKYGRAWEKHSEEIFSHQTKVSGLFRQMPSNMSRVQLENLIKELQAIENQWKADEYRLNAVPE